MDTSNPVMTSDRATVEDVMDSGGRFLRQNLTQLSQMCNGAKRTLFGVALADLAESQNVHRSVCNKAYEFTSDDKLAITEAELAKFSTIMKPVPRTHKAVQGVPLHPPHLNVKNGYCFINPTYGNPATPSVPVIRAMLSAGITADRIEATSETYTYSNGTRQGYLNRLEKLLNRPMPKTLKPVSFAKRILLNSFKVYRSHLPDWHDADELINNTEVTYSSNAGFPYCTNKKDAMPHILNTVLPEIIEHISNGTISQYLQKEPEMCLVTIKNKRDRLETGKIQSKTRPYANPPAHWSLLFSAVLQPFTAALENVNDNPMSHNAYGMTVMNGGIDQLIQTMSSLVDQSVKERRQKILFYSYSDDTRIIIAEPNGVCNIIDPDIEQHDSSVDINTIKAVIEIVKDAYTKAHGASPFWESILNYLVEFAVDPPMLVSGTTVVRKKNRHGLLSGTPGTTLLGTAKSIVAWADYIDKVCDYHRDAIYDAKGTAKYMLDNHGMTIKKGTYKVTKVDFNPPEGGLYVDSKFLGIKYMKHQGVGVPYISPDEWLSVMLAPRDNGGEGALKESRTMVDRRNFDRSNGYLITGAAFQEEASRVAHTLCDLVPDVATVMTVQANRGTGDIDVDNSLIVHKNFKYPSSDVHVTNDFCLELYKSGPADIRPTYVFPELHDKLFQSKDRKFRELMMRCVNVVELKSYNSDVIASKVYEQPTIPTYNIPTSFSEVNKGAIPKKYDDVKINIPQSKSEMINNMLVNKELPEKISERTNIPIKVIMKNLGPNGGYEAEGRQVYLKLITDCPHVDLRPFYEKVEQFKDFPQIKYKDQGNETYSKEDGQPRLKHPVAWLNEAIQCNEDMRWVFSTTQQPVTIEQATPSTNPFKQMEKPVVTRTQEICVNLDLVYSGVSYPIVSVRGNFKAEELRVAIALYIRLNLRSFDRLGKLCTVKGSKLARVTAPVYDSYFQSHIEKSERWADQAEAEMPKLDVKDEAEIEKQSKNFKPKNSPREEVLEKILERLEKLEKKLEQTTVFKRKKKQYVETTEKTSNNNNNNRYATKTWSNSNRRRQLGQEGRKKKKEWDRSNSNERGTDQYPST
nr:MAG: polyprotein [Permutotetraviridae sp.]